MKENPRSWRSEIGREPATDKSGRHGQHLKQSVLQSFFTLKLFVRVHCSGMGKEGLRVKFHW